jgi:hypothetical protein
MDDEQPMFDRGHLGSSQPNQGRSSGGPGNTHKVRLGRSPANAADHLATTGLPLHGAAEAGSGVLYRSRQSI